MKSPLLPEDRSLQENTPPGTSGGQQPQLGGERPQVSILAIIGQDQQSFVPRVLEGASSQVGVGIELILIDQTRTGLVVPPGVRVVRCASPSRGRAWLEGAAEARGEYVAWWNPACKMLPTQLSNALRRLSAGDGPDLVTCTGFLHNELGEIIGRVHGEALGETPGPFWDGAVVMRASVMELLRPTAFFPVELELWQTLHVQGRAGHVHRPGFAVGKHAHDSLVDRARQDGELLALAQDKFNEARPELSVSICTHNRKEALVDCLEAYSRQLMPVGSFELVIVEDGSTDGTCEMLQDIELPVPHRLIRSGQTGLGRARNASLDGSTGTYVLFAHEEAIPGPEYVEQHLRAHRSAGQADNIAVMGDLVHCEENNRNALVRQLDQLQRKVPPALFPAHEYQAMVSFYPRDVSVLLEGARRVGGVDGLLWHAGCEATDLGLRLDAMGFRIHHAPAAVAKIRTKVDFESLRRHQLSVAKAHVNLFQQNPELLQHWAMADLQLEACEESSTSTALSLPIWENALKGLCEIDLAVLELVGGGQAQLAASVLASIEELLAGLNRVWWHMGYVDGMREAGITEFGELQRPTQVGDLIPTGTMVRPLDPPRIEPAGQPQAEARQQKPELSVIIPTHNRPRELVQLIERLTQQDLDPERFEVIVVDDGSKQPACGLLGPLRTVFDLDVITQAAQGPGAARNRGIERARADIVVFFNDDAVPAADNLTRHLEIHQSSSEALAVMGTFSLLPKLLVDSFAHHVETSTALFAQTQMQSGVRYPGTSFCTGNLSVLRSSLEAVGGFDESFLYAGGEDSELGLRLDRELGLRVLYDSSVVCEHDHVLEIRGFLKRMRVIGWAAYRIEAKHGNTGLVQGQPTDGAGWETMQRQVDSDGDVVNELLEGAEDACQREREGGLGPVTLEAYREIYGLIAGYGMRCGILAAHNGVLPLAAFESPIMSGAVPAGTS